MFNHVNLNMFLQRTSKQRDVTHGCTHDVISLSCYTVLNQMCADSLKHPHIVHLSWDHLTYLVMRKIPSDVMRKKTIERAQ